MYISSWNRCLVESEDTDIVEFKEYANVWYRNNGHTTSTTDVYHNSMAHASNVIGFIATKANNGEGYAVYKPTVSELKEFGSDIFRLVWSKGTTIVKIDIKSDKLYFLDNTKYEDGIIKFQSPIKFTRLILDKKEFIKLFK